jgi:serine/threonine-protein kinase
MPELTLPSTPDANRSGTLWAAAMMLAVVVAGGVIYLALERFTPPRNDAARAEEASEPGSPPVTPGAVITDEKVDERLPARLRPKQGTLTLVTRPEAEVYGGNRLLGATPLLNFPMPAGTHRVRVKGPDGVFHVLTAPIQSGRNTAYRLAIDDLPVE